MRVDDLVVEVRNASLARVGQLLPKDLEGFTAVLRFNASGTWTLTLPTDHVLVDALRAPGAGIIVTGPSFSFSGPTNEAKRSQSTDDPEGVWTISGLTDDVILGERLAYPTPASADVTAQTSEADVRTGKASTVMIGFVNANLGPSAPAARKLSSVSLAADGALGSTITASARFETLGKLLTRIASLDGLGFTLKQSGSNLVFSVYQPTDRSAYVRMDIDNKLLTKSEYTYTAPGATRAIVAGAGDGIDRTFLEVTTSFSTDSETSWGRRIEVFKDQRSDVDTTALTQAGTEELTTKGKTLEAVSVSPSDDVTMAFGTDWFLGDKVSVVVGSTSIVQIVTEVGFKISEDGVRIGATVGSPSVADAESTVADVQVNQEERISNLERNTSSAVPGAPIFANQVKHEVKLGQDIAKGLAVYVSSANGTNMIVSKASNTSEATSSKTMGLLETGGATNDFVNVVTEGLLAGLNTNAATAGDPVWLGTNGALIFGLASKPSAPAHLVYLGTVTRAHATEGEIFVHVQNGFEIDELHNVAIASVADNNLLAYDSASSLWKNQTAAQAALATTSDLSTTNASVALKAPIASPTFTGTATTPALTVTGTATVGSLNATSSSDITNAAGNAILNIRSTNATTNAYIGLYRAGGTRTGYMGHASTSNNSLTINCDDATGAQLSVGTDGTARIWSMDVYNRTYSSNPTVCVTTAGTLGRVTSATKYKLDIEPKEVSGTVLDLEPKTWLDKALAAKQGRYLAAVEAGEDLSEWEGYTADWVQPRVPGLIAEDLVEAGLEEYVFYGEPDEEGNREIEGIQYDRLWIELIPFVKELRQKVSKLESLEARIIALENNKG